jgi:adenine-specific DNA-methyltransferase
MSEDQPEKMSVRTGDVAAELRANVQQLLPGVMMDGVLDVERLADLLKVRTSGNPTDKERFGLMWAGRRDAVKALQEPSMAALVPDVENSINWDTAQNVFIEGDNLEVLKLMQKAYNDQVDLVYIDPPYNTGNDFVYNDDFSESVQRYLEVSGQIDAEGNRLAANSDVSGRKHSKWISMMYPRLMLARNILKQDGLIVVSIDDNEVASMTLLLDEVFGENNRVGQLVWHYEGVNDNAGFIKRTHEYVLIYGRSESPCLSRDVRDPNVDLPATIENSVVKNGPKNPKSSVLLPAGFPCDLTEGVIPKKEIKAIEVNKDVEIADNSLLSPITVTSGWSSRDILVEFITNGFSPVLDNKGQETTFSITASGNIVYRKKRDQSHVLSVLRNLGTTMNAGSELKKLGIPFDYPKPVGLIEYLVSMLGRKDALVVDFFAGSGTTAHAVASLNDKDGGSRRFLLINARERTQEHSQARVAGIEYISEMTRSRIGHVLSTYSRARALGVRFFHLGPSSFVDTRPGEQSGIPLLVENTLRESASDDAIVAEVLLKSGVRLDVAWNRKAYAGEDVVESGSVAVVVARKASDEVVAAALGDQDAHTTVFLEDSFADANDVKTNAYFGFKQANKTMKTV